ncbi:acyltransferase family protein [Catellatospora methionotrophica]|uniref:acyltransferase family protein n=1 Tax=Catellatospora methionotrophica TaxID=121620 RepID=UPI0033D52C17
MADLSQQPLNVTTSGRRLPALTGMRFLAAAAVFFFHAMYQGFFASPGVQEGYVSIFGRGGHLGVGFFFVLSGFVLTWAARDEDTVGRFWRRRLVKIYPNHVLTFAVAFILLTWVSQAVVERDTAILNFFLLQAWFPQLEVNNSVNSISWSLSCEVLFYLSFPLLYRLIRHIRPSRLWAWAAVVAVIVAAVPLLSLLLPHQPQLPWAPVSENRFWFIYFFPPVRLLDFVFGMLLARLVITGRRLPFRLGGAIALTTAAYALAPLVPGEYALVAVMLVPVGLVIAAGAAADAAGERSWLASPAMVWLGNVSFAFYLWHFLVLTYGGRWLGAGWSTPAAIGVLALLFGVTLLLSWATFALFENPIMKRFAGRSRPTPAPAPVAEPEPEPALAK